MTGPARERLLGYQRAFDEPVTLWIVVGLACALVIAPLIIFAATTALHADDKLRDELWKRYRSWLVLVPLMTVPVLLGALWTILAAALLSLLCYREFSRVTGLAHERTVNATAYVGIFAVHFAVLDHWYGFFVALFPLTIGTIAAVAIFDDQPQGYIRRVALASLGYTLFGAGLAHLGYMANSADYRPLVLMLLLAVELNDVFAYLSGRTFGRRKLAPKHKFQQNNRRGSRRSHIDHGPCRRDRTFRLPRY
jgi:phosphatidate cytidylyltransferase